MKPRFGLLRGKEFMMKDLYTFDSTVANATESYAEVNNAYDKIFQTIGVTYLKGKKLHYKHCRPIKLCHNTVKPH